MTLDPDALRLQLQASARVSPASAEGKFNTGRRHIRRGDREWPECLDELGNHKPPDVLYLEGHPLEVGATTVAVVGTRRPTAAGVEAAEQITRGLVEAGFTIVSGLALGIDSVAHRTALRAGGQTIAVLGNGLDVDYPAKNRSLKEQISSSGTVLTEHPEGTQPLPHHFPLRNRIVVGLVRGVLVIEGGMKSGALITARIGIDANRFVWAVPGSIRNSMAVGPNELIRRGQAGLVTNVKHVLEDIAPALVWEGGSTSRPLAVESLSEEEKAILCLLDDVPLSPDRIIRMTGLPTGTVALSVSRLEVRGFVLRRGAGYEITQSGGRVRSAIVHC